VGGLVGIVGVTTPNNTLQISSSGNSITYDIKLNNANTWSALQTFSAGVSATTVVASSYVQVQSAAHIYSGSGVPSFAAATGDIYLRTDGSVAGTCIYFNTSTGNHWAATSA
jgi:hypothetical protein